MYNIYDIQHSTYVCAFVKHETWNTILILYWLTNRIAFVNQNAYNRNCWCSFFLFLSLTLFDFSRFKWSVQYVHIWIYCMSPCFYHTPSAVNLHFSYPFFFAHIYWILILHIHIWNSLTIVSVIKQIWQHSIQAFECVFQFNFEIRMYLNLLCFNQFILNQFDCCHLHLKFDFRKLSRKRPCGFISKFNSQNHQKMFEIKHFSIQFTSSAIRDNNHEAHWFYGLWSINCFVWTQKKNIGEHKPKFIDLIDRYQTITMKNIWQMNLLTLNMFVFCD